MEKFNEKITNFVTLNKRAVVSVFIVLAVIFATFCPIYFSLIIFGGIALSSVYEYAKMVSNKYAINENFMIVATLIMLLVSRFTTDDILLTLIFIIAIISSFVFLAMGQQIVLRENTGNSNVIETAGAYMHGLSFIVYPWCATIIFLNSYKFPSVASQLIFAIFLSTWICDTSAYLIGTAIGRHKLAPKISEKKSVEGFVAGFIGSVLASFIYLIILSAFSLSACDPLYIIAIGVICGTFGQIGDLAESLIKREIGVKDSGNLLPGHGGFLDRFDSILLNITVFFLLFAVVNVF